VIAKEKGVLVDSLQKQEDRDAQGRFLKGRSGNPEGRFRKGRSGNPKGGQPGRGTRRRRARSCCSTVRPRR
jgi:hypothetical protein